MAKIKNQTKIACVCKIVVWVKKEVVTQNFNGNYQIKMRTIKNKEAGTLTSIPLYLSALYSFRTPNSYWRVIRQIGAVKTQPVRKFIKK